MIIIIIIIINNYILFLIECDYDENYVKSSDRVCTLCENHEMPIAYIFVLIFATISNIYIYITNIV